MALMLHVETKTHRHRHTKLTLRMDCIVCSGYVTVVATALATAPMMKTSTADSLGDKRQTHFQIISGTVATSEEYGCLEDIKGSNVHTNCLWESVTRYQITLN